MDKERQAIVSGRYPTILVSTLILGGLYLTSFYSYLLFHSLAEVFSIVVACGIFIFFWNSRRFLGNGYFLFIGIAYFFVGGMDLIHTLGYPGMGVFPGYDTNLPAQLWIAARYLESLSLLVAPLFLRRRLKPGFIFVVYTIVTVILLESIFYWEVFPTCFIEGVGLTPFKKVNEYVISLIFVAAIALLFQKRREFPPDVFQWLIVSIIVTIFSELSFTLYIHAYDLPNLIGHLLKIVSFYLIYKAFIEAGLAKPYDLLFRNLKQSEEALCRSETRLRVLTTHTPAYIYELDANGVIRFANRTYEGLTNDQVVGTELVSWFPESQRPAVQSLLKRVFTSGRAETNKYTIPNPQGEMRSYTTTIAPILVDGRTTAAALTAIDTTERQKVEEQLKAALAEKEVLLKEVHHRVKNNLIALTYLIEMQAEAVEGPEVIDALGEFKGRVRAMGLVHEKLYRTENLGRIDFGEYLEDMTADLFHALAGGRPILLRIEAEKIFINVDIAIPCGLIVNELVTNALKYAFPEEREREDEIQVGFGLQGNEYVLSVSDNGIGLPPELDWRKTESLGLNLVNIWAKYQLQGSLEVDSWNGTAVTIRFARRK